MEGEYRLLGDDYVLDYQRPRKQPECWCFLLFIIAGLLYAGVFVTAGAWGGSENLRPFDSVGQQCQGNYSLLYFVTPAEDLHYTTCVSSCDFSDYHCRPNYWVPSCDFNITTSSSKSSTIDAYPTEDLWGLVCYPKAEIRALIQPTLTPFAAWLLSVQPPKSLLELVAAIGINCLAWVVPCGLCVLTFLLMRYAAIGFLWAAAVAIGGIMAYAAYATCETADSLYHGLSGSLLCLLSGLYFLLLYLLYRQFAFISLILQQGCSFLYSQFLVILTGSLAFPLVCLLSATGIYLSLITYLTGDIIESQSDIPFQQLFFPLLQLDLRTLCLLLFEVIVGLWMVLFCIYYAHMAVAACVAKWHRKPEETLPLLQFLPSLYTTLMNTPGQVSFGALLQTFTGLFALVLMGMTTDISQYYPGPGRWILECLLFCSGLIAGFISLLVRYILIYTVLMDTGVVSSIRPVYSLIVTNVLTFLVYSVLYTVLELAAIVGLSWASLVVASIYLDIEGSPGPIALVAAVGTVASVIVVFEVFRSVADTLLLCHFQDTTTVSSSPTKHQLLPSAMSSLLSPK